MQSYRDFRKNVLRMSLQQMAALLGCDQSTLGKIERRKKHHPATKAIYLFLEKDPAWCIKTLVINATDAERSINEHRFILLQNLAKSSLTRDEYPTWEELMYKRHPELAPKTP